MTGNNGFKMSMSEFKGFTTQSLSDIKEDLKEIKESNTTQHRDFYKRIGKLERTPSFSRNPIVYFLTIVSRIMGSK